MKFVQAWFYRQMAIWSQIFKRPAQATHYWERLLGLRPGDPRTLMSMALIRAQDTDKRAAIELLGQALKAAPNNPAYWFNQGFLMQEQQLHAEALVSFERALELDPKLDRAWYGKALSLIKLQRLDEATEALIHNTELQPMSPFGWYQLAHVYNRQGQVDGVKKVIRKLSGFEPKVALQLQRETGVDIGFKAPG